jgi:hypothetical protein
MDGALTAYAKNNPPVDGGLIYVEPGWNKGRESGSAVTDDKAQKTSFVFC